MRKAIILTLVLACIALFAVGCQTQPQAGEAFRMPSYQQQDWGARDIAAQRYAPSYEVTMPAQPMPEQPSRTVGMTDEEFARWLENFQENFCDASMAPKTPQEAGFVGMSDEEWEQWLENFQENFCDVSMTPEPVPIRIVFSDGSTQDLRPKNGGEIKRLWYTTEDGKDVWYWYGAI